MVAWPNSLIREIAERRVVIFVGAGISKAAHPALPTWPDLLRRLAALLSKAKDKTIVERLVRKDHMLDAAQIILDGSPKS